MQKFDRHQVEATEIGLSQLFVSILLKTPKFIFLAFCNYNLPNFLGLWSFKRLPLLLMIIFMVSSISNKVEAQCCAVNAYPASASLGFESTFTPNSSFPNATFSPTNNARAFTGNGTAIGVSGWDISSGAGAQLIRDASRSTEGTDFVYVDFKATDPDNYCVENSTALSTATTCTANRYVIGRRYVISADYVVFNKNAPDGGTGQAAPIFDYFSGTYISIPAYINGVLATFETAVSWADVATSWKKVYGIRTMTSGTSKIAFSVENSNVKRATSGILFDNTSFTQLVVTASGIGANVSCGGNSRVFTLNPVSNFGGIPNLKYTVAAPTGYTISPATGIYGQTTSFTLTKTVGSAIGTGPLNITIADEVNTNCTVIQAVADPGLVVAGTDQNLTCSGTTLITTATLGATLTTGGTWTQLATNPSGATVTDPNSATSGITGLTPGVFKFVWSNPASCSDTVKISVPNCACIKPDAGTDQNLICVGSTAITSATLGASPGTGTWTAISTNPAGATITTPNSATSGLTFTTGSAVTRTYQFIWTTDVLCADTVSISVPPCPCTKPNAGANQFLCIPTSTATITPVTTGGFWYAQATNPATVGLTTTGSIGSVSGITTEGDYNFIYYRNGCTDTVKVTLTAKPNAGTNQFLCRPTNNTTLTGTPAGGTWAVQAGNPAVVTLNATSGAVSNLLTTGLYRFIYTLNGCRDTVSVTLTAKPNAGIDQNLCFPTSTATLAGTLTGGTWSVDITNSASSSITNTGAVTGMTAVGSYNFIYTLNTCADTVKVTVNPKPNAGTDQVVCKPLSTITLTGTASGGTWAVQTGNPATTTVTNLGVVTGMTALGTYKYIYTLNGCRDTVSVIVKNQPTATITQTPATCVGLTVQNNASITVNSTGDKYSTDTTTAYASATAFTGSFTVNNLTPATASTFRIFNTDANCYIDTVVAIKRIYCPSPVCSNTIGGTVFNDFNNNGVFNTNDSLGFVGVKVYAYNCAGVKIDSATTDYKGKYTFANVTAANDSVRIEFDTKTFPVGIKSTYNGADGRTTVQFTKAPNCSVDLGLSNPIEYCQNNPNFSVICFTRNNDPATEPTIIYMNNNGARAFTPSSTSDATNLWATPSGGSLVTYPIPVHTDAATKGEVGTTYGLAYDRYNKKIYSGAYMRAFSPMGTNTSANGFGEGVIYQIPVNGIVADNPSKWLDLETLFGDNIAGTYIADPTYPGSRVFGRTGSNPNKIGYTGLGSIEISGDGKELYVVNLNTQEVFVIPIAADGSAPTSSSAIKRFPIPNSECAGTWADGRPIRTVLGLGVHPKTKKVFVSTTCSGTALTALKGIIYSFDPADNSPTMSDFSKEMEIPMNIKIPTTNPNDNYWYPQINHPWVSVTANSVFYSNDVTTTSQHTQPWLAEIAFDIQKDGSYGMVVGTRNRYHDLINSSFYVAGGVLQKVCNLGNDTSPIWSLENNKVCGELTSNVNWTFASATAAGFNTSIYNRFFKAVGKEGTFGAGTLDIIPGSGEVFMPTLDNVFNSGTSGIAWLNTNTGNRVRDNRLLGDFTDAGYDNNNFTKANNWAEIEAMCDVEPIQIGNRLWIDTDKDGVQDPCNEPAIKNMVISLYNKAGILIAKDTTDANGEYYFDATNVVDTVGVAKLNNLGPQPNTQYFIVIGKETFGSSAQFELVTKTITQGSTKYELTTANSTTNSGNDQNDNDFSLGDSTIPPALIGFPSICVTTPNAGSDHTFDGGFKELCIKPIAGIDQTPSCVGTTPITTATLAATAIAGATWTQVSTNPSGAVVTTPSSATSGVTGLTPGVYQFIWATGTTCSDTVKITIQSCVKGSLGDFVWKDTNNNGKQDAGEAGVKNVIIELFKNGTLFSKDTTDASGKYGFAGLDSASYRIRVITSSLPVECDISIKPDAAGVPDSLDSDVVLTGGFYESQTVIIDPTPTGTALKDNPTLDVGLRLRPILDIIDPCSCFRVEYDPDEIKELYEFITITSSPGETWKVVSQTGVLKLDSLVKIPLPVGTLFTESPAGKYTLSYTIEDNIPYSMTLTNGTDTLKYSNVCQNKYPAISLTLLGTTVCKNGLLIPLSATSVPTANFYEFFYIDKITSQRRVITSFDPNVFTANDTVYVKMEVGATNPQSCPTKIVQPVIITTKDCGKGSLGDFVWKDTNNNGKQDSGEAGVKNVIIELYKNGLLFSKDTTDVSGKYGFVNLDSASYKIRVITSSLAPNCAISIKPNAAGVPDSLDSDVVLMGGFYESQSVIIDPTPTGTALKDNPTLDVGLYSTIKGKLGDYVFLDYNIDGIQNGSDKPVKGIIVELYNELSGTVLAKDTTDINGKYLFDNLPMGRYRVRFVPTSIPPQLGFTLPTAGADTTKDSNADTLTGFTKYVYILKSPDLRDSVNLTLDAGLKIVNWDPTGYIYCEENGKILKGGIISVTGPPGSTVDIIENGSKGHYRFLTDRPGIYVLNYSHPSGYKLSTTRIARPAAAPGFSIGLDGGSLDKDGAVNGLLSIGSLPNADTTYLQNYSVIYNPYYLTANILIGEPWITENNLPLSCELLGSLGDFVWKDNNNNGKQDAGEPGVPNVQIELYRNGILLKKDTTDASGKYGFAKLDSASYKIRVITSTFPADCSISTKPNQAGVPDSLDSDITLVSGFYESQSVIIDPTPTGTALRDNPTIDVGLYSLSCSITATYVKGICNNNGTLNDISDDYFTISVTATINNGGNRYEVVRGATAGKEGMVLNASGTNAGSSVTVGRFKADGTTTHKLTVRDSQNSNCYTELNVSAVNSCSVLPCPTTPICLPIKAVRK